MLEKEKKYSTASTSDKVADFCAWIEEKQGEDILALDVRGVTGAAEAMVLATARNVRHSQALADFLLAQAKQESYECMGMEGYKSGQWVLVDFNDILVHIFLPEYRGFYDLEGLWATAKTMYPPEDGE